MGPLPSAVITITPKTAANLKQFFTLAKLLLANYVFPDTIL